jgi:hypothetical protein
LVGAAVEGDVNDNTELDTYEQNEYTYVDLAMSGSADLADLPL